MRRESPVMPETRVERPVLLWQPAGGEPVEYEVWPERPLTIGRDGANTVVIDSAFVSKSHAVIRYTAGQYMVEDLKSANGTRVNSAPVAVSVLGPGDVLEVGDQRFVFIEAKPARSVTGGLSKTTKLALVAIATAGVLGVLFALILSSGSPPASSSAASKAPIDRTAAAPGLVPPVDLNSAAVRDVLAGAAQAGIKPVDALFDEGVVSLKVGRLREATQLFGAVLGRDPKHEAAARRFAEAKAEWAQAISDHFAEAERASGELRLDDAMLEWGKVLLLTDASDRRHKAAQDGIDRVRQRLAR